MTVQYLIDSENVGDFWISLLELPAGQTELIVFYTRNSPHMSYESLIRLKESDRTVTFIKCYEGTNALDFQLVSELGYRISKNEGDSFVIVTNDTGFDAAVKYWRRSKKSVKRITGKECKNLERRRKEDLTKRTPSEAPRTAVQAPAEPEPESVIAEKPAETATASFSAENQDVRSSRPVLRDAESAAEPESLETDDPKDSFDASSDEEEVDYSAEDEADLDEFEDETDVDEIEDETEVDEFEDFDEADRSEFGTGYDSADESDDLEFFEDAKMISDETYSGADDNSEYDRYESDDSFDSGADLQLPIFDEAADEESVYEESADEESSYEESSYEESENEKSAAIDEAFSEAFERDYFTENGDETFIADALTVNGGKAIGAIAGTDREIQGSDTTETPQNVESDVPDNENPASDDSGSNHETAAAAIASGNVTDEAAVSQESPTDAGEGVDDSGDSGHTQDDSSADGSHRTRSRRSRSRRSKSASKKQDHTEDTAESAASEEEKNSPKPQKSAESRVEAAEPAEKYALTVLDTSSDPSDQEIARIVACIGSDNLAELHNQLATFYGDQGKAIYLSIKNNMRSIPVLKPDLKQKFAYYCEIIFARSDYTGEYPSDISEYLLNVREKLNNLNSLRYALQKHYGKEKGRRFYFLLKPFAKTMYQM